MIYSKQHPEFVTITCLDWQPVLREDRFKDVIIESLIFLTNAQRVIVYGFVIMSNHFHMIWQMIGDHRREDVQRDFLKYTGQQILKLLRNEESELQKKLLVQTSDRKQQIWERNSLGVSLWSQDVLIPLTWRAFVTRASSSCQAPITTRFTKLVGWFFNDIFYLHLPKKSFLVMLASKNATVCYHDQSLPYE